MGRPLRDFFPIKPGQFKPGEVWVDCHETRGVALRNRFVKGVERWSTHTRDLRPWEPGMMVILQNQHGISKAAKKWDRTGLNPVQPVPRPGNDFHPDPVGPSFSAPQTSDLVESLEPFLPQTQRSSEPDPGVTQALEVLTIPLLS